MEEQTAVEWLINEINHGGLISKKQFAGIVDQAKEMEKQQIENAFNDGYENGYSDNGKYGEDYYSETFKNTKE